MWLKGNRYDEIRVKGRPSYLGGGSDYMIKARFRYGTEERAMQSSRSQKERRFRFCGKGPDRVRHWIEECRADTVVRGSIEKRVISATGGG